MKWLIHYDVAALIICSIVFVVFILYKNFPSLQTFLYYILLSSTLISVVFDLITAYTNSNWGREHLALNYALNVIYLLSFNIIPAVYFCFTVSLVKKRSQVTNIYRLCGILPFAFSFVYIILSPLTGFVFHFSEASGYTHGPGMTLLYINSLLYLLLSVIITIRYHDSLSIIQRISVGFFTASSILVVIIQYFLPKYLLIEFIVAISMFFIYLTLQNPLEFKDALTGSFNRSAFIKMTDERLDRQKSFKVLALQIDGLKFINEKFGMEKGDNLIKRIASFLHTLTPSNRVFHLSASQFALLIPEEEDEEAYIQTILARFEKPFYLHQMEMSLWVYLCCISCPEHAKTINDILDTIDYSLRTAKHQKRNCVVYVDEEILAKKRRESAVEHAIEQAIANENFDVYYQPIFSVSAHKYASAEALIRLNDPELGFIPPDEFIPMAEKNGLIIQIGEIVFRKVCQFIMTNQLWEKDITCIHVNLSVVQCMQEDLSATLIKIADSYQIPYSMINLEITETAAVDSGEKLLMHMHQLMDKGILFSLDDYGTGYSNTANIMQNPYALVKIDKSMVWAAETNDKAMISLKHTISMIKDLNMAVLAEGVETLEQCKMLIDMQCEFFQGYYYSKPLPGKDFLELLTSRTQTASLS